ncbi:MAG: CRISPR-associated helicase Cas3', partial [Clostridiales bacterium]|nr:CRISPR-associated helicase Cas3' [Clostridiales bacterium]
MKTHNNIELYAHTKTDPATSLVLPEHTWQKLDEHLSAVACTAQGFADSFDAGGMAYAAGILHDIGKATEAFQARLRGKRKRVDHKSEGGRRALELSKKLLGPNHGKTIGTMLAYIICGHHGGLPDYISESGAAGLLELLKRESPPLLMELPEFLDELGSPLHGGLKPKAPKSGSATHLSFYLSMLIRMVFSALVDADYLDTEKAMDPEGAALRKPCPPIAEYAELFAPKLNYLQSFPLDNPVNKARRAVLNACLRAAENGRGFFKLTVPTGGGKTLSSLAFALRHALRNNMRRVIYAIPFTSITEQTAEIFRGIFGGELVLEHHSNAGSDNLEADEDETTGRPACENWDAQLIVTTNVQLFESLFAAKPSKTRKLHNIANSVIILDEAQTLPDSLLLPTLAALKTLVADFGVTVVFCTATQPAIRSDWLDGLTVHEIIDDTAELFSALDRTKIINLGETSDNALTEQLQSHEQALCVVNTRQHARQLFEPLKKLDHVYHLSALMCPEHRSNVIAEIKERLKSGQPCIVISTQLIEAGVDIDFPCVYRAAAGIDSIAQAAGRCNREGMLLGPDGNKTPGEVFVFYPEKAGLPQGWFSRMASLGSEVMAKYPNPLLPEAINKFFELRYTFGVDLDEKHILRDIEKGAPQSFSFREIQSSYKVIDDKATYGVIVPYDEMCKNIL